MHLQFVGEGWERALTQLHTCTCAWTIMRKTGLRVSKRDGLPKVCMQDLPDLRTVENPLLETNVLNGALAALWDSLFCLPRRCSIALPIW